MPASMRFAIVFTLLAAWTAPSSARAVGLMPGGRFEVGPVRLDLSQGVRSGLISLRNNESDVARVQVSAFAWSQGPHGEVRLAPTQAVAFFPSLFALAPGQTRQIRVGVEARAGKTEKTFRLIIAELPPLRATPVVNGVRVLTRLSIPIFVAPVSGSAQVRLSHLALSRGHVSFALGDTGQVHLMTERVRVLGSDAAGNVIFKADQPAWYLLAGGDRLYDLALPKNLCPRLTSIDVVARTDHGTVSKSHPMSAPQCG